MDALVVVLLGVIVLVLIWASISEILRTPDDRE